MLNNTFYCKFLPKYPENDLSHAIFMSSVRPGRSKIHPKRIYACYSVPKTSLKTPQAMKQSLECSGDYSQPKIMISFMSQIRVKSQIQFLAIYVKTEGLRAQRCYTSINKHAYSASFKPKTKSLRPSEAEIMITCNRDHAPKRVWSILN